MAKTKQQKQSQIDGLTEGIKTAKSVVFANFQGLKVSEMEELRAECREQNINCMATKKTLVGRALKDAGMDVDTKIYQGGVAAFFGNEDEVAPAQIVAKYAKSHDVITLFGGILEGSYINADKVLELSKLPSKHQLLGQLVGTINAPVSGFVNVLAGNLRGLVGVLNNIKEQKA
ncbi:MAG: 50S ribosomal protein L10 [Candidatus Magasanikbacteria bacterium]|uniref:Large ribosomal subunit protein uL10 n=1 Tax=Candidatus Magasanikbacteria bacterium CG10_big_fil_rev_8_21_14_0_10_38_6 TaxID=1974647 RepID=A0A2M6P1M5_9BACT|nr:50S ribosomal protein L10 [Candidatus Magasanikbacteria bacterium]NCS71703.1 50S ribosomal protein L10 [Candidatus Magasanikbacteria bacterium]PIR77594.1 MAG: 50S ribosomal protein L10 [Candidatus Magasanikbacteria bacterium CG10_big_fil_rev_8_21_14_0_10_38_6]